MRLKLFLSGVAMFAGLSMAAGDAKAVTANDFSYQVNRARFFIPSRIFIQNATRMQNDGRLQLTGFGLNMNAQAAFTRGGFAVVLGQGTPRKLDFTVQETTADGSSVIGTSTGTVTFTPASPN